MKMKQKYISDTIVAAHGSSQSAKELVPGVGNARVSYNANFGIV